MEMPPDSYRQTALLKAQKFQWVIPAVGKLSHLSKSFERNGMSKLMKGLKVTVFISKYAIAFLWLLSR